MFLFLHGRQGSFHDPICCSVRSSAVVRCSVRIGCSICILSGSRICIFLRLRRRGVGFLNGRFRSGSRHLDCCQHGSADRFQNVLRCLAGCLCRSLRGRLDAVQSINFHLDIAERNLLRRKSVAYARARKRNTARPYRRLHACRHSHHGKRSHPGCQINHCLFAVQYNPPNVLVTRRVAAAYSLRFVTKILQRPS